MKRPWIRLLSGVSGALLLAIGAAVLLQPHQFFASNGATLGNEPSLLSEIRAPGGLLIGCAIVMLLGAFRSAITRHALFLAALVYGSYGLSRLASLLLDGVPSVSLVGAMAVELIIGLLCSVSLMRFEPASVPSITAGQEAMQQP